MKKRNINPILIGAVVCGLIACYSIYWGFQKQEAMYDQRLQDKANEIRDELQKKGSQQVVVNQKPERPVVYASSPINAGQKIEAAFLKTQPTPVDLLPGALGTVEEAVGKYASKTIGVGEALTPNNVSAQAQRMSTRLTPGMRAMALPIFSNDANSTGGFALDGDYVDLLLTYTDNGSLRTITVLQNVKILYNPAGQRNEQTDGINPAAGGSVPPSITFEVTPTQAEILVQLLNAGTFHMVLRNAIDTEMVRTKGYSMPEFLDNPKTAQARVLKSQEAEEELLKQLKTRNDEQETEKKEVPNAPSPIP